MRFDALYEAQNAHQSNGKEYDRTLMFLKAKREHFKFMTNKTKTTNILTVEVSLNIFGFSGKSIR